MDNKIDENQLVERIIFDLLKSLKKFEKSPSDQFKYDCVILEEKLTSDFSFEKLFQILNLQIPGDFRVFRTPMYIFLRMDFNKNNT
jgi:hypothetical protein